MKADFLLALKSTIDKVGHDLAQTLGPYEFIDIDDTVNVSEKLSGDDPALLWSLSRFVEAPRDPLYSLVFEVGVKTVADPARYQQMDILGEVSGIFYTNRNIDVVDYSKAPLNTSVLGYLFITRSSVNNQQFDNQAGVRLVSIEAVAQRYTP